MLRRVGPSLRHFLLGRNSSAGHSSCSREAKMSRPVQARRLEGIDKNIWVEFVKLAATYSKVNLGQGFPDFPPPDFLTEALTRALSGGNHMLHQYTRAFVREQISFLSTIPSLPISPGCFRAQQ